MLLVLSFLSLLLLRNKTQVRRDPLRHDWKQQRHWGEQSTINFTVSIDFFTITIVLITTTIVNITITTINIISSIMISPQVAIDEKSHQWFGATVASSGEDGVVVVSCVLVTLVTLVTQLVTF